MGIEPTFRLIKSQVQDQHLLRSPPYFVVGPAGIEPTFRLIKSQVQSQHLLQPQRPIFSFQKTPLLQGNVGTIVPMPIALVGMEGIEPSWPLYDGGVTARPSSILSTFPMSSALTRLSEPSLGIEPSFAHYECATSATKQGQLLAGRRGIEPRYSGFGDQPGPRPRPSMSLIRASLFHSRYLRLSVTRASKRKKPESIWDPGQSCIAWTLFTHEPDSRVRYPNRHWTAHHCYAMRPNSDMGALARNNDALRLR